MKLRAIKNPTLPFLTLGFFLVLFSKVAGLTMPLRGEEGNFAYILLNGYQENKTLVVGSLDKQLLYVEIEHPILLYRIIGWIGNVASHIPSYIDSILLMRLTSILFIIFPLIALVITLRNSKQLKIIVLIPFLIYSMTPLFQTNVFKLQTDTLVGSLAFSIMGFFLFLIYRNPDSGLKIYIYCFVAGLIGGVGKQEWAISFILSILVTNIFIFFSRPRIGQLRDIGYLTLFFLIGIFLSSALNYMLDRASYIGGFNVIARTVLNRDPMTFENISALLNYFLIRSVYIFWPLLVVIFLLKNYDLLGKNPILIWIKLFLGIAVLANILPTLLSTWNLDMRYLVPAAVLTIYLVIIQSIEANAKNFIDSLRFPMIVSVSLFGLLLLGLNLFYFPHSRNLQPITSKNPLNTCVVLGEAANFFKNPTASDWISVDMGIETAEKIVATKFRGSKFLCK